MEAIFTEMRRRIEQLSSTGSPITPIGPQKSLYHYGTPLGADGCINHLDTLFNEFQLQEGREVEEIIERKVDGSIVPRLG